MLHLGGARTALFNDLYARGHGATFVVRFEDTDTERSDVSFEADLLEDLAWLGVHWQEGPDIGGPHAPYRQSERAHLYRAALSRLEASGAVYRCFCDEGALAISRDRDISEGRAPRYRGTCRNIPVAQAAVRAAAGEPHCWRFAVGPDEPLKVDDAVHGAVTFRTGEIGDFIVARSDGTTLYDLACAVDDAAMGITLVLRGDDHLPNTPRQILILRALGKTPPRYGHVPLVAGPDGRPLAKSRGAEPIRGLREAGFLPEAVVNHLALLGWSDPAGREVLSHEAIAEAFELSRISGSSPMHDPAHLRWLNKRHMAALDPQIRAALIAQYVPVLPGVDPIAAASLIAGDLEVAGDAATLLAGVATRRAPDQEATAALSSLVSAAALESAAAALVDGEGPDALRLALREAGLPARDAMPALRAALTGRAHGLPVATIVTLLGVDESLRRISQAAAG
jgi:glutamyl-tRNA synthetase